MLAETRPSLPPGWHARAPAERLAGL